jgi:hypothetical protein
VCSRKVEHAFGMSTSAGFPPLVHRSAGDVWASLIEYNRERQRAAIAPVVGYQALAGSLPA